MKLSLTVACLFLLSNTAYGAGIPPSIKLLSDPELEWDSRALYCHVDPAFPTVDKKHAQKLIQDFPIDAYCEIPFGQACQKMLEYRTAAVGLCRVNPRDTFKTVPGLLTIPCKTIKDTLDPSHEGKLSMTESCHYGKKKERFAGGAQNLSDKLAVIVYNPIEGCKKDRQIKDILDWKKWNLC